MVEDYRMTWTEALIYAETNGKYIPTANQVKNIDCKFEVWSSTTFDKNTTHAFTNCGAQLKTSLLNIVLVNEIKPTGQDISYYLYDDAHYLNLKQ